VNSYKILAVIPARGGSKGIPNKNIILLGNKPLITYSIEAAKKSKHITHSVVSTDSMEIADIARCAGALVPFIRPSNLAGDTALSLPVIIHATEFMEAQENVIFDIVLMLQPTTPFRTAEDIDTALEKLLTSNAAGSIISVVDVGGYHPLRMKKVVGNVLVNYIDQGYEDMRPRQHLPPVFIRNGAIYAVRRDLLIEQKSFSAGETLAYVMPHERSINIDTLSDLYLAERCLENL